MPDIEFDPCIYCNGKIQAFDMGGWSRIYCTKCGRAPSHHGRNVIRSKVKKFLKKLKPNDPMEAYEIEQFKKDCTPFGEG